MARRQTLAEKYAEYQRNGSTMKSNQQGQSLPIRSSTPSTQRQKLQTHSRLYNIRTPIRLIHKQRTSSLKNVLLKMPGSSYSPVKSLRFGASDSSSFSRYTPTNTRRSSLLTTAHRINKRSNLGLPRNVSGGGGVLHSLWQLAKRFGTKNNDDSSELAQLKTSTENSKTQPVKDLDIESLLHRRKYDKFLTYDDPVDESIQGMENRVKESENKHTGETTSIDSDMKLQMKLLFEKEVLQIRQDFKQELDRAKESLRQQLDLSDNHTRRAAENNMEELQKKVFSENEMFLTQKYETEAKLERFQNTLLAKERDLNEREQALNQQNLKAQYFEREVQKSLRSTLEVIKAEYGKECLVIDSESQASAESQKINNLHGRNLLKLEEKLKLALLPSAFFILHRMIPESADIKNLSTSNKDARFLNETQDKLNRCHEFVADYELEYLKDPENANDVYCIESLSKIEECFEKAKRTILNKLQRSKSKEKNSLKILSAQDFLSDVSRLDLEQKLQAFISNHYSLRYRDELVRLLRSIIELLRNIKFLKAKIMTKV